MKWKCCLLLLQFVRIYTSSVFYIVKNDGSKMDFVLNVIPLCSASHLHYHVTAELSFSYLFFWIYIATDFVKKKKHKRL